MKKKPHQKRSPATMIAIEPANREIPLSAFLSLFEVQECVDARCGRRRSGTGPRPLKINNRNN